MKLVTIIVLAGIVSWQLYPLELLARPGGKQTPTFVAGDNETMGREFYLAIQPNEVPQFGNKLALEIHVSAPSETRVRIEFPAESLSTSALIPACGTVVFTTSNTLDLWEWELRDSESISPKLIRLVADKPVAVQVLSARRLSSEGYTAIPVDRWGREYRHVSYYDRSDGSNQRGTGFIVLAAHDSTLVDIRLQGRGEGRTVGGRRIGESWQVILDAGEAYMVHGDGVSDNFDLSGTHVVAGKPVGLIAFHMRTRIPVSAAIGSRDHLVAMLPPVATWGTDYVSRALDRGDYGDFFRVLAASDSTRFWVRMYDEHTQQLIATLHDTIVRAGDFAEFVEADPNDVPRPSSIRGVAVWQSDKPVLLMQYSYSQVWDGNANFNPFMMALAPLNRGIRTTSFYVPEYADTNYLDVFALPRGGDTVLLQSVKLNGEILADRDPAFLRNRIAEANVHYLRLILPPGAYTLDADTDFLATYHGTDLLVSYAWPLGRNYLPRREDDTLCPHIAIVEDYCGDYLLRFTELRNGKAGETPPQRESGLASAVLDNIHTDNYTLVYRSAPFIDTYTELTSFETALQVVDKSRDAYALVRVTDRAGNDTIAEFRYTAPRLGVSVTDVNFGTVPQGLFVDRTVEIFNTSDTVITINTIGFCNGAAGFAFVDNTALPVKLGPFASMSLGIRLQAGVHGTVSDTLAVRTACAAIKFSTLRGRVERAEGKAIIITQDVYFGHVSIGQEIKQTISIRNVGSEPFSLQGFLPLNSEVFRTDADIRTLFPLEILPGGEFSEVPVYFAPKEARAYFADFLLQSSAECVDSIAVLSGVGRGSPIVDVKPETDKLAQDRLHIFPNPSGEESVILYATQESGSVRISVITALGREILRLPVSHKPAGEYRAALDLRNVAQGAYYCVLETAAGRTVLPLLVLRN